MKSMRKQLLGSVILALFVLVGCKGPQMAGGEPRKKVYHAIISLSPSTTELASITGVPIIGRTSACNYPQPKGRTGYGTDDFEPIGNTKAFRQPGTIGARGI